MKHVILTETVAHVRATFENWADALPDQRNDEILYELSQGAILSLEVWTNPLPYDHAKPKIQIFLNQQGNERVLLDEFSIATIN